MKRVKVESSNLVSVGYDPRTLTLEIEFSTAKIYRYQRVPSVEHAGLMKAESKGKYFAEHIRNNPQYPYEQVK